jgi:hypothetical protein
VQPSRAIWRSICTDSGAHTTTVVSTLRDAALPLPDSRPSKSSGMSRTISVAVASIAAARRRANSAPTCGWTIWLSRSRAASSANTIAPSVRNIRDTVLLPEPIPPDSPITTVMRGA